jgi:FkbM family methyltransferase
MKDRLEFLQSRGVEIQHVIDVGAHHGEWCQMFKSVYPDALVHSFEANPLCIPMLQQTCNDFEICLLGDVEGKDVTFYISSSELTTGSSIFREQTQLFEEGKYTTMQLRMRTLDNVLNAKPIPKVDLLKLDVQGAEKLVLMGAEHTLQKTNFVLLEASVLPYNKEAPLLHEMVAFMEDKGFRIYDIMDIHHHHGYCNQCDILFLRKDSHLWPVLDTDGIHTKRTAIHDMLLTNGDRAEMVAFLRKKRSHDKSYRVVAIGDWDHELCDVIIAGSNNQQFPLDVTNPRTWTDALSYIEKHGKFDFSVFLLPLSELQHPQLAIDFLERISHAGYIAVPSKYSEVSRHDNGPRGYISHRWIFTIKDKQLVAYPKLPFLEHESFLDTMAIVRPDVRDLSFFWYKTIPFQEVTLGNTTQEIRGAYYNLLYDEVDKQLVSRVPSKRVAFILNDLGIRGTGTVVWLYAHYNETILGNKSIIVVKKGDYNYDSSGLSYEDIRNDVATWFYNRFEVHSFEPQDIDDALQALLVDVCVIECSGEEGEYVPTKVPSIAHCIFSGRTKLGTVHTVISEYLTQGNDAYLLPNVIEIHETEQDLRQSLGIPSDAIVFGRYGGYKQFNIEYARETVLRVAANHPNIYFLFMNTEPLSEHYPNIIYIQGTREMKVKKMFINTCNAMLHARKEGETFGCACGEFALANKPVITALSGDTAHIYMLGEQAIVYDTSEKLEEILTTFKGIQPSYHRYNECTPEKVMPFLRMYIDKAIH